MLTRRLLPSLVAATIIIASASGHAAPTQPRSATSGTRAGKGKVPDRRDMVNPWGKKPTKTGGNAKAGEHSAPDAPIAPDAPPIAPHAPPIAPRAPATPDGESAPTGDAAQPSPAPTAESLFELGLKAMLAQDYAQGCPALAESYRLDPLAGALFTLAECEGKWGKSSRALSHYRQYLSQTKLMAAARLRRQGERPKRAREQVAALAKVVPMVTIVVDAQAPAGAVVKRDGNVVAASTLGRPLPFDPGRHTLTLEVDGDEVGRVSFEVAASEKREVSLAFEGAEAKSAAGDPKPQPTSDSELFNRTNMRTAAVVSGGVGALALLIGTISGAVAIGESGTVDEECIDQRCSPKGLEAVDSARTAGGLSTAGFAIGVIGLAAGATLWFLAPDETSDGDASGGVRMRAGVSYVPQADGGGFALTLRL